MAKRETQFGGPFVDPRVTDPAAQKYKQEIEERKRPAAYNVPVGGGPNPPIPRLDMPHQEGMTMADQARAAQQQPSGMIDPATSIFPEAPQHSKPPAHLLPSDILPEAARQDPQFREGQGSMYAAAQPHLAYKYGVIRNKQHIPPQQLTGGRPGGLSEKTVEGLKAVQEFQQKRQEVEGGDTKVVADATASPSGAAARLAGGTEQLTDEDRQKVRKAIDQMDDFDWNTFREMMIKDVLNNDEQRQIIEERLKEHPLSLDDLIMNGYVRQLVPVVPNKFEPEFQSLSGDEDLALKRLLVQEAKSLDVTDKYLMDKYSLMAVACGIYAINKKPLPHHRDEQGKFSDKLFWEKFNLVLRYPMHMVASLGIHFFWFDVRVRKLFVAEKLGNG